MIRLVRGPEAPPAAATVGPASAPILSIPWTVQCCTADQTTAPSAQRRKHPAEERTLLGGHPRLQLRLHTADRPLSRREALHAERRDPGADRSPVVLVVHPLHQPLGLQTV